MALFCRQRDGALYRVQIAAQFSVSRSCESLQVNNSNGKTYVYENTTYWDKESKSCKHHRKSIGHLNPDTEDIVPNYHKSDKQPKTLCSAFGMSVSTEISFQLFP